MSQHSTASITFTLRDDLLHQLLPVTVLQNQAAFPPPPLCRYHISLVELLAACAEGKNVYTEIKCTSLLPLEDVVRVVTHDDCITEVLSVFSFVTIIAVKQEVKQCQQRR